MLLNVSGLRTTRELVELVKALSDYSAEVHCRDLAAAVTGVEARESLKLTEPQANQVACEVVTALPGGAAPPEVDPNAVLNAWVGDDHVRLYKALLNTWLNLCARLEAEHEAADRERAAIVSVDPAEPDTPRLPLPGWLFMISHDPHSGKPQLMQAVIGFGLAAAIMSELLLADRVHLEPANHRVLAFSHTEHELAYSLTAVLESFDQAALSERLAVRERLLELPRPEARAMRLTKSAEQVLQTIEESQPAPLRTWLVRLAPAVTGLVREELLADGIVERRVKRRLGERVFYAPTDTEAAVLLRASAVSPLVQGRTPDPATAVLLELVRATGLDVARRGEWYELARQPRQPLPADFPRREPLAELLELARAEVTTVITSPGL